MHWLPNWKKYQKKGVGLPLTTIQTWLQYANTFICCKMIVEIYLHLITISAKKQDLSISNAEARQLAVMKEVLYDQQQVYL